MLDYAAMNMHVSLDGRDVRMSLVHLPDRVWHAQLMDNLCWIVTDPTGQHHATIEPNGEVGSFNAPRTGAMFECVIDALQNGRR